MKNKLLSEIAEALKKSQDKVVRDSHIAINHNGYEYKVYKSNLKDLQRMAYVENCLDADIYIGNNISKKERIKLVEELKELGKKTNWLYK